MNLGITDRLEPILEAVKTFIRDRVEPVDAEFLAEVGNGERWALNARQQEILEGLKSEARKQGLWNFWLTDSERGHGLTTVEYAYIAEETGRSHLAAEAFNCSAPDTGNMEVLERFGSEEQKREWLEPLLDGKIRSAYAMTEPGIASSDATNISTTAVLQERRVGHQWRKDLHLRCGRPSLQDPDLHGAHESRGRPPPATLADPRTDGCAGRGSGEADGRLRRRPRARTATCTCVSPTCACRKTT